MTPELSPEEFREAALLGLGRAILYLRQIGSTPDVDLLRWLLMNDSAFDAQVEGGHDWYVLQLIEAAGRGEELRRWFLSELPAIPISDERDEWHRMAMLERFAQTGSAEALRLLYERTGEHIRAGSDGGLMGLIELEGMDAIRFAAEAFARAGRNWDDLYTAVTIAVEDDPGVMNSELVRDLKPQETERKPRPAAIKDYETFKALVDATPEALRFGDVNIMPWLRTASESELAQAATDFLALPPADHERRLAYLSLFARRAYPLDPASLIELAQGYRYGTARVNGVVVPDAMVRFRAYIALRRIQHPAVRAFALEQIVGGQALEHAIDLLALNYQPGDWDLIKRVAMIPREQNMLHGIGMGVREVFEAQPSKEAAPALIWFVEHGPCSHCRFYLLKGLAQIGALPGLLRAEAAFDSYADTREWAAGDQ